MLLDNKEHGFEYKSLLAKHLSSCNCWIVVTSSFSGGFTFEIWSSLRSFVGLFFFWRRRKLQRRFVTAASRRERRRLQAWSGTAAATAEMEEVCLFMGNTESSHLILNINASYLAFQHKNKHKKQNKIQQIPRTVIRIKNIMASTCA